MKRSSPTLSSSPLPVYARQKHAKGVLNVEDWPHGIQRSGGEEKRSGLADREEERQTHNRKVDREEERQTHNHKVDREEERQTHNHKVGCGVNCGPLSWSTLLGSILRTLLVLQYRGLLKQAK